MQRLQPQQCLVFAQGALTLQALAYWVKLPVACAVAKPHNTKRVAQDGSASCMTLPCALMHALYSAPGTYW